MINCFLFLKKIDIQKTIHGSVLKPNRLKNIAAQLLSAADRVDAGMPTSMAISSLIAIGTSHGLVLVFDPKQVLKWCLGSTAVGQQYGSVSALSFNKDCTRLLSGFAKGQITMWDLTNGKLLRTITDAHPPGSAVLHVKFTDSPVLAVCSDSGGSVFELEMKRLIGVRTCESKCLFSGSRGEVCVVEPLHMNLTIKDHPMQDVMVVAMATLSKVLVVTLRPQLKVVFTHPLKGNPTCLPLLAWHFVVIQVSERDRVIDPVLVFARESTIYFFQVICNNAQDIKCSGLQKITVPYKMLSVAWMNPRVLVTMDTNEKLHVIDVRSEEELEVLDVSSVQLVYNNSHFKSLATGGNVSQALAMAGEEACYQTVVSQNGQLFLLGTKGVYVYTLRNWRERIDVLVKQNKYNEALALALSFYDGRAKAVIGLTASSKNKKEVVSSLMLDLLFEYVDLSMTTLCPEKGKMEELEAYYQNIVPVCVDYCLHLSRTDILFGRIYDRFAVDYIARGTFLECLEPYILCDKLRSIPPSVMKDLVEHYQAKNMLEGVVNLCWSHGLYDAIIYVYNKGMHDYTTPLEELLGILQQAVRTEIQLTDEQIRLGNKLLVYISCCLAGRAYPLGDIPEDMEADVKKNVFQCITRMKIKAEDPTYPYLRTLLQFDTREFLNVLALAFEEKEFNTEEGIRNRQRVVDILLQVMVESGEFTPTQIGVLFTFLARQMASHENTILVNRVLFEQVLEFLANPEDDSRHEERQQALMELLQAGGLQQVNEEKLLSMAENAKFFRVCELLYEKRRQFDKILSCYLRDPSRKYHAFSYITSILNSERFSVEEQEKLKEEAFNQLEELVSIDCKQAAQMVISTMPKNLGVIANKMKSNPKVLFEFLKGVMSCRDSGGSAIHTDKQVNIDPWIIELYVDLMCQFRPQEVYNYIKLNEGYRLEQTLEICRRHKNSEATAYLLEKAGDIQGAFGIILTNLQNKLKALTNELLSPESEKDVTVQFLEVQALILVVIQLCQRNSGKMDEAGRESLWFPLLETVMSPQRKLKDLNNKQIQEDFKKATHHVLNSMMGYIALPTILHKIMQDPAYSTGKFGEVRELILGMLETYNYEQTLMETCKNLMNHDIHVHLKNLTTAAKKGYVPAGDNCSLCTKQFVNQNETDTVIIFRCGHSYHKGCLQSIGSVHVIDGEDSWVCFLCSHRKRGQYQSTRFHRSHSNRGQPKGKDITVDPQHSQALDFVKSFLKTPSRMSLLSELSSSSAPKSHRGSSSIFNQENFQLKLAPPPAMESAP
uniref:Vacuolar protein sorting-associated protein 8-like protein n=1 Tax=Magallana gigas TaxID=29159 RepID=K1R9K0_MAGGI